MLLKDLTIIEKRDLVYLAAHRSGEALVSRTKPDSIGNIDQYTVRDAIKQFRDDLNRVVDLIEECGLDSEPH